MKRFLSALLTLVLIFGLFPTVALTPASAEEVLSLTWNQGTYYDDTINTALTSRKYTVIPCSEGDVIRFDYPSTDWAIYVYYADAAGSFGYVTSKQGANESFVVEAIDGRIPTELRLTVFHRSGSNVTITDELWATFDVVISKTSLEPTDNTFNFATQNFGLWNDGVTQGVAADQVETRAAAWQAEMAEHDIDILAGQEWLPYLDSDKTVDANEKVFGSEYPYMYGQNTATYDGKNIISRTPLTDISYTAQVSNVGRRYAKAYTTINGKKVCIINAHLSFEEDINTNRKEEIVELLNVAQTEPYVIVAGDFNVFTPDEFKIFEEAGYSLANAGAFGEFNTWPNLGRNPTADVNRVLDNIIVGPGIKINSVQVDDTKLSDHALLVAQLELLEEGAFTDNRLMCEHCNQFVEWIPLTLTNGGSANAVRDSGHYYLPGDLTSVNSQFYIGVLNEATPDVVIDLRGHAVKSSVRAFYVRKNSKLTIVDTVGCGTVSAASTATGGFAYIEGGSTFNLYDGSVYSTGTPTSDRKGGTIYLETSALMNVYGGEIYGGKGSHGGAIYAANKNTVNISGGTISGGTATSAGGAIYMYGGTLNVSDGTITGGQGGSGGGLYLSSAAGNLTGGTIHGNSGTYGGNVHTTGNSTSGGLNLGNCNIYGGTATGAGPDIYLSGDGKLKVLKTFAGTSHIAVNAAHLPDKTPGAALSTSLDSAEGYFPGKLILDSISTKPQLCGAEGETSLYIASAALVDAQNNLTWYAHNKSAVENYGDSIYLLPAAGELSLAGGSYTVDLAGQTVNITGTGSVTCFDSANDTYETFGTATVDGVTLVNDSFIRQDGKLYFTLEQEGVYSFHRMGMQLQTVSLRPAEAGLYYTGSWTCDDTLAAHIDSFGVAVSLKDIPGDDFAGSGNAMWTGFAGAEFESGVTKTGVMISGILKDAEDGATQERIALNPEYAQMAVLANTYVTVDGVTCTGTGAGISLYDLLKTVSDNMEQYSDKAAALQEFMSHWRENGLTGEPWDSLEFA